MSDLYLLDHDLRIADLEATVAAKDAEIVVLKKQLEGSFENAELQARAHDAEYDALKAEREIPPARRKAR